MLEPGQIDGIISFFTIFFLTFTVLSVLLTMLGQDLQTAISGALTALANVGPGVGPIIGPAGNFSSLSVAAKWALALGMYVGRLELLTVFVLLIPGFWREVLPIRQPRWSTRRAAPVRPDGASEPQLDASRQP